MTDIQKRFDRILSIYLHLQSTSLVTADELAYKCGVSQRTIYRDIRSLICAGVPIYGEAGQGYSLVQGYKMPPLQFTKQEALSFVAAEKLINKYTDKRLSQSFGTAVFKIKAILRSTEKQDIELAEDKFIVRGRDQTFHADVENGLSMMMESIVRKKAMQIDYQKPADAVSQLRKIEPIGVFVENNFWYVMAHCHLRGEVRQFRLDRILGINMLADDFMHTYKELAYYLKKQENSPKIRIVFSVQQEIGRYLHWERQYYGFLSEEIKGDSVLMFFDTSTSLEAFARWCLMFSDYLEVIEPLALKERILQLLQAGLRKMS